MGSVEKDDARLERSPSASSGAHGSTEDVGVQSVGGPAPGGGRRATVARQLSRVVEAIRKGDDDAVQEMVLELSRQHRILAPLALVVGAIAMLFEGVKLLVTNWRLTLVQVLPAMWIWVAMFDLKAHLLHGKSFHVIRGPILDPDRIGHRRDHRSELLSQRRVRIRDLEARPSRDPAGDRRSTQASPHHSRLRCRRRTAARRSRRSSSSGGGCVVHGQPRHRRCDHDGLLRGRPVSIDRDEDHRRTRRQVEGDRGRGFPGRGSLLARRISWAGSAS